MAGSTHKRSMGDRSEEPIEQKEIKAKINRN